MSKDLLSGIEKRPLTPWTDKLVKEKRVKCPNCQKTVKVDELKPIPIAEIGFTKQEMKAYIEAHSILYLDTVYRCSKCHKCLSISIDSNTRRPKSTKIRCSRKP